MSIPETIPASSLIDWTDIITERGEDGITRLFSMTTGEVVGAAGPDAHETYIPQREVTTEDGKKLLIIGTVPSDFSVPNGHIPYTPLIALEICQKIVEGYSLTKLCALPNMPGYGLISKWRRRIPEFKQMLLEAYEDQADYHSDESLDTARDLAEMAEKTHEDISAAKVLIDTLKWRTAVQKPRTYSPKMQVSGDPDSPLQIIVDTGIRRNDDAGYNRDEGKHINDAATAHAAQAVIDATPVQEMPRPEVAHVLPKDEEPDGLS